MILEQINEHINELERIKQHHNSQEMELTNKINDLEVLLDQLKSQRNLVVFENTSEYHELNKLYIAKAVIEEFK